MTYYFYVPKRRDFDDIITTHVGDTEDEYPAADDGGAGDGEWEEEPAGCVHKGADDGPDSEAVVEGGVTPGFDRRLLVGELSHED